MRSNHCSCRLKSSLLLRFGSTLPLPDVKEANRAEWLLTKFRYLNRKRLGKPKSPTLSWSTLQPMLQRALCDVLILLDCCFAGSAARASINGTNELLAACGRETTTAAVTDRSFTRNLLRKIKSFNGQPFTVNQLYERLINDRKRIDKTPQYAALSDCARSSIVLAPVRSELAVNDLQLSVQSSTESGSNDSGPLTSASTSLVPSSETGTSGLSSPSEGSRVLIAVSLAAEASVPEVELWKKWLSTDAPDNIRRLKVTMETAFSAHSTLVLVSVPISVWNHLPDTSAYRFVDFIKSGNLLACGAKQSEQHEEIFVVKENAMTDDSSSIVSDEGYQFMHDRPSLSGTVSDEGYQFMHDRPSLSGMDHARIDHLSNAPSGLLKSTLYSQSIDRSIIVPPQPTLAGVVLGDLGISRLAAYTPSASDRTLYNSCPLTGYCDFRIFTLRQGSSNEPIEGTLMTCSLEKGTSPIEKIQSYEALSYHWGNGEASFKMTIITEGVPRTFNVRSNLHAALNQLRLADRYVHLGAESSARHAAGAKSS